MKKKALSILLSAAMLLSLTACGGDTPQGSSQDSTPSSETGSESGAEESSQTEEGSDSQEADAGNDERPEETVVLRYGTHWLQGSDPNYVDEATGEYTMDEQGREAHLAAMQAIKDTYNVEFEYVQYPNDVREELMTKVLAGETGETGQGYDIALLWGGCEPTILGQNVLQDLSAYKDLFADEEISWMMKDEMFGGNYLLNAEMGSMVYFPLVVNLTMLEKVDSLKDESGKTIYPMDLFKSGEWTWSRFKDYLSKIQAYYANIESADGSVYDFVQAYETDHRYAALAAIHANGSAIYEDSQVTADSQEAIDAVNYVKELMDAKILVDCGTYDNGFTPQWQVGGDDFGRGSTVFTDCANWQIGGAASSCAERGESIAIVPWPRPDRLEQDSPEYMQYTNGGNSVAIPKGVSPERTELAIKAFILYWETFYKTYGGVDKLSDYLAARAEADLQGYGVDIFNETYGQDLIDCYLYIKEHMSQNFAHMMGLWDQNWEYILGKSYYGMDGMSSYDVAIKAHLTDLTKVTDDIAAALQSGEVKDNQKPKVTTTDVIVAAGTDAASVDWTAYFTVEDSVDGPIAVTADMITTGEDLDLATPGEYADALVLKVSDQAGNEQETKVKVVVYNGENTTPPTVTAKAELPEIAKDTDTSGITWKDYLESAVDADGLDVSGNVTADLSQLDTTTPGTYEVILTVADHAGNESTVTLEVTVSAGE